MPHENRGRFPRLSLAVLRSFFLCSERFWAESRANIEEATADIVSKLERIGEEHGKRIDPKVYPVDIHKAIEGLANSRIDDLPKKAESWGPLNDISDYVGLGTGENKARTIPIFIPGLCCHASRFISVRISCLDQDASKVFEEVAQEEEEFRKKTEETEDKWRQAGSSSCG